MVKFCPKCKKILPLEAVFCPTCGNQNLLQFCQNCKKIVPNSVKSCPTCDRQVEAQVTTARVGPSKEKKKKRRFPIFLILFLLAAADAAAWWFRFSSVDKVTLSTKSIELTEGEITTIEYEISPKWAVPRDLKWESSNEDVAEVDQEGKVTAKEKGTCYIILSMKGNRKNCEIIVKKEGTDLAEVYKTIKGDGFYCTLARDESYMEIDTNPNDEEYYLKEDIGAAYVIVANEALGLPDSVAMKMSQTRALDGRQTETYGDITVSWTYHPDHGLDMLYEVK